MELRPRVLRLEPSINCGFVLDFDADGKLVGIDTDRVSEAVSLSRLEVEALPLNTLSLAG